MNPLVVVKIIDLAIMGLTAWMEWDRAQAASDPKVQEILDLRNRVKDGDVSPESAMERVGEIMDSIQSPLDQEIEELKRLIP